jgi:hypothetical protein
MNIALAVKGSNVERRSYKRVQINVSSLPNSVPSGSVCNVRLVRSLEHLKCGDLVLVFTNGAYRPRRFLRSAGGWAWLGGDQVGELPTQSYSGELFQVVQVYSQNRPVVVRNGSAGTIVNWACSFL